MAEIACCEKSSLHPVSAIKSPQDAVAHLTKRKNKMKRLGIYEIIAEFDDTRGKATLRIRCRNCSAEKAILKMKAPEYRNTTFCRECPKEKTSEILSKNFTGRKERKEKEALKKRQEFIDVMKIFHRAPS